MAELVSKSWLGLPILITGGFGFIGSHLTRSLLAAGAHVVVLDNDMSQDRPSLLRLPEMTGDSALEFVNIDVCDRSAVSDLLSSRAFHTIFHLAGYSVIERSTQRPYDALQTNVMGALNLLDAVRLSGHQPQRIVITSTDKVYGEMDGNSYLEDSPLRGIGLYDAGKLAADVIARSYWNTFGTPISILRLCNVFGPHDYNTGYRLFPRSLSRIFDPVAPSPPVLYYESLSHWRDYVYVDDVVTALLTLATHEAAHGEVFNMAHAIHISTPELMKLLVSASVDLLAETDPDRAKVIANNGIMISTAEQSALTIQRQHLDSKKITSLLGFTPSVPFELGLARTVAFHSVVPLQSHPDLEVSYAH